jgi:hypothetical protein
MSLPSADPADEGYILALLDVFSISQLQYLGLIQTGDNTEVQLIQCAQDREARFPYQTLPTIDATLADFLIQERQQIFFIALPTLGSFLSIPGIVGCHSG